MSDTFETASVAETEALAARLADEWNAARQPEDYLFIALRGDLGAGKTAFVRGLASVLSPGSRVKSPSYTIVNEYTRGAVPLYHFDLYRTGGETESFGFDEYTAHGDCVVEWSEYLPSLPPASRIVTIEKAGDVTRRITVSDERDPHENSGC